MLDPKLLRINLHELTTLRMELGPHGGPEMKVTCHSAPTAARAFKIRGLIFREDSESGLGMGGFLQKETQKV